MGESVTGNGGGGVGNAVGGDSGVGGCDSVSTTGCRCGNDTGREG